MRFMVLMIPGARERVEGGELPDPKMIERMMSYNADLAKAGILLALDGLHPSSKGARLSFKSGKATVKDGPFTEARELIGGYWMWQVKSKEEAVEWAKRCPAEEGDTLELRQVFEMADFGPAVEKQEEGRVAEIGAELEKNKSR
jgi:hypothetical protein